jgi:hypothetical protein
MKTAIAFAALLVIPSAFAAPKQKSPPAVKPDLIAQARERVKEILKDPDSAKFRTEFVGKDGAVCGFVNAKNSYGGYSGFERYVVSLESVLLDSGESWKMDSRWADYCADFEPAPNG